MTEDDAFRELERNIQAQKNIDLIYRASAEAARFIYDKKDELGIMTLRKAFEIGFKHGYTHGTDSRTK